MNERQVKIKTSLIVIWIGSFILMCALAGFIGAAISREQRDRGFFEAGWEGGRNYQRDQQCK